MPSPPWRTVRISAALQAAENARTLLNRRMRDSGGKGEGGDDEGSGDGPSMRSMNFFMIASPTRRCTGRSRYTVILSWPDAWMQPEWPRRNPSPQGSNGENTGDAGGR